MTQDPTSTRTYIRRSLPMLGKVRGEVACLDRARPRRVGTSVRVERCVRPGDAGDRRCGYGGKPGRRMGRESGALLSRADGRLSGLAGLAGTPLPFAVLLGIWAAALLAAQVLGFARAWIDAQVEWRLLTVIRRRVHDHIQSLSLDFFTGARVGALMQRVQLEAAGVQRLLTVCVIPPAVDAVVMVAALAYLLALSWQMTIVALVLAPLAFIALRFTGKKTAGRDAADDDCAPAARRRTGRDGQRHLRGPGLQCPGPRSERFHEASDRRPKALPR